MRNLIEAEEDRDAMKMKAVEEGVDIGDDDRSSGFMSLESDGYRESREVEVTEQIVPEQFLAWMDSIPEHSAWEDSDELPELDEWDARSVEVWSSVSVVARGSDRRRIDRWQRRND